MKVFLLVLCTTFVVHAIPEAGYSYSEPSNAGNRFSGGFSSQSQTLSRADSVDATFSGESSRYYESGSEGIGNSYIISGGQPTAPAAIIQKHIYVHAPPPDQEEFHQQRPISAGVPQKHYKIIFIKVPSSPQPTPPQIPLAVQNLEKTIVYVLVKKPDELEDHVIPTATPTLPSKPEVYFIKYKTQREQHQHQQYGPPSVSGTAIIGTGDEGVTEGGGVAGGGAGGFSGKLLGSLVG